LPGAPSGPLLPAEAIPQAAAPATASYDKNGKFVDPAGGTGVFAAGADTLAPAENWVDLMLAPKQA
jgi:phospholipid/cholesterol/gamma-HCH transport system substrate-binding protein